MNHVLLEVSATSFVSIRRVYFRLSHFLFTGWLFQRKFAVCFTWMRPENSDKLFSINDFNQ